MLPLIPRSLRASPKREHTLCPGTAADLVLFLKKAFQYLPIPSPISAAASEIYQFFFFFFAGSCFSFLIYSADVHVCIISFLKHGLFVTLGELGRGELDAVFISPL